MNIPKTIERIRSAFGGEDPTNVVSVSKAEVLEWMKSTDLEVRGALYSKIANPAGARHVAPALEFEDYYNFVVPYLEQCIEQDPEGEWSDSRYLAGHQLVAWIVNFWNNDSVPRNRLREIKHRLAALYIRGDKGVRDAVVNAVLEHLFEQPQIASYFKDWKDDSVLAEAYQSACAWTEGM